MTIGLVMLVLNEAEFLEASLRSVQPFVEQCLVIDQGSTDGSDKIARKFGAELLRRGPDNFLTKGEKYFRDLAVRACACDWLLYMDADEVFSDGWRRAVDEYLREHGDQVGMISIDYWQMVGSVDFHTPDSPLPNERPILYRMHDGLKASESLNGTKCHCNYRATIEPNVAGQLPSEAALFHLGYCKSDLTARFTRNILRCDWSKVPEINEEFLHAAATEPLNLLWDCIPSVIPPEKLPESLRIPKWKCVYNPETRRITERIKL